MKLLTMYKTLIGVGAGVLTAVNSGFAVSGESIKPNIIFIYGDDVGFGDVGAYGAEKISTPNIDRLAREGLRFTDGHSTAATCSPSRFSLLTGIHGFRHGVSILPPDAPLTISPDMPTLPKLLKKAGYTTAVIGKWHLGIGVEGIRTDWNGDVKPGPLEIGFDVSFLLPSTNDRVPCVFLRNHRVVNLDPNDPLYIGRSLEDVQKPGSTPYPDGQTCREAMTYYQSSHGHNNSVINGIGRIGYMSGGKSALWNDEEMSMVFVKEAQTYIAEHKDEPFFLYFASQCIHVPRTPNKRFQGSTELGYRGDSMVEFDWVTGEILNTLDKWGLSENTIVIFSSDNGPAYDDGYEDGTSVKQSFQEVDHGHDASGNLRGGKNQIYEGGTRVPLIIRWPERIRPGVSHALVSQIDFFASFAELLGIELLDEEGVDSRSSLSAFLGTDSEGQCIIVEEAKGLALRQGQWKYIRANAVQNWARRGEPAGAALYNLEDDIGETNNLIGSFPEKAEQMRQQLQELVQAGRIR